MDNLIEKLAETNDALIKDLMVISLENGIRIDTSQLDNTGNDINTMVSNLGNDAIKSILTGDIPPEERQVLMAASTQVLDLKGQVEHAKREILDNNVGSPADRLVEEENTGNTSLGENSGPTESPGTVENAVPADNASRIDMAIEAQNSAESSSDTSLEENPEPATTSVQVLPALENNPPASLAPVIPRIDNQINALEDRNAKAIERINSNNRVSQRFRPKKKKRKSMLGFFGGIGMAIGGILSSTVGMVLGAIGSVVGKIVHGTKRLVHRSNMTGEEKAKIQRTINYKLIPGRKDNAEFEEYQIGQREDQEVFGDVRRVPIIWEKASAESAEADPYVQINAYAEDKNASIETKIGHSFLTLGYSRKSRVSGNKVRYALSFGFYPKGGVGVALTPLAMTGSVIPGQLMDDWDHSFSASKRYRVNNRQINRILKAAENYAAGGYELIKRNCTTFVADMTREAGIEEAASDLKDENLSLGLLYGLAPLGNAAFRYMKNVAATNIENRITRQDMSYQFFGQRMFSQSDLDRTISSGNYGLENPKGYSPYKLFDTLRANAEDQFEEQSPGQTGYMRSSFEEIEFDENENDNKRRLVEIGDDACDELLEKCRGIDNLEKDDYEDFLISFKARVNASTKKLRRFKGPRGGFTIDEIQTAVADIRSAQNDFQKWYYGILGGHSKLWDSFSRINSIIETFVHDANNVYAVYNSDELGEEYQTLQASKVNTTFTNDKGERETIQIPRRFIVPLTQAFGSVSEGIKGYARYEYLKGIREQLNPAERREFSALERRITTGARFERAQARYILANNLDDYDLTQIFRDQIKEENLAAREGVDMAGVDSEVGSGYLQASFYMRHFPGAADVIRTAKSTSNDFGSFMEKICTFVDEKTDDISLGTNNSPGEFIRAMGVLGADIISERLGFIEKKNLLYDALAKSLWNSYLLPLCMAIDISSFQTSYRILMLSGYTKLKEYIGTGGRDSLKTMINILLGRRADL